LRLCFAVAVLVVSTTLALGATASAAPVATSDPQYQAYGAVFPDPLAVCQQNCDPNSRGRTNATQFIQWQEFTEAITFMNTNDDWRRYMEVWPLDGARGSGAGTEAGEKMWPGNNLAKLEWDPKKEYQSAGIAKSDSTRQKSDLIAIRVTDENVPDANKKRYALSLSIHGIERAGAEGGIRAMEEIVTAVSEGRGDESILPKEVRDGAVTWQQVLANTIIYFTFPNPDGWRRGSVGDTDKGPGIFFQRYNGNGVDPNRDWPDIGYSFRRYSGGSEPETRAFQAFYRGVQEKGGPFAAGDDLHGMPFADALSYTLMPHGRHDLDKDFRIREASKVINRAQYHAVKWSPYIIDNDEEATHCEASQLGDACDRIYAQTWGSVYDTINYTTTGTLGDWFDSSLGLNADGIDNEMAFSHLDRNITFEPHGEQLHVAGNKAIIYSHLDELLRPPAARYSTPGKNGYVASPRLSRERKDIQAGPPAGTSPQDDKNDEPPQSADPGDPEAGTLPSSTYEFDVVQDADTYNGGVRVDVRATNVQGIGAGVSTLKVQCQGCDRHVGVPASDEWVTVAEDYNQSPLYAQAGLTAAVNRPQAGRWRAVVDAPGGVPRYSLAFSSGPATSDGATGGDEPPFLAAYDVANTDFFDDLNGDAKAEDDEFAKVDPKAVLAGTQSLDGLDTLVLADSVLPGFTGRLAGEPSPNGPPTADFTFAHSEPTTPSQGANSCAQTAESTEEKPFSISAAERNSQLTIRVSWAAPTSDYDLFLYRQAAGRPLVGSSAGGPPATAEELVVPAPEPGNYVIVVVNCSAPSEADPWSGTADFAAADPVPEGETGAYTDAEKNAWIAKLKEWVGTGGNLVLTDAALRGLSELTTIPGHAISRQTVYVGQTAFTVCAKFTAAGECEEEKTTLDDPLARDVAQPGARFNSDMRRQLYEPTPIGYAIQDDETGAGASTSRQFDIDQVEFEKAGGRVVGASTDGAAGPEANAQAVPTRTMFGEIPTGEGRIRLLGALLPQPSTAYDHQLGLEPYAVTYTGYIVLCNLIDCQYESRERTTAGGLPNPPAPPGPVQLPFDARVQSPLLASNTAVRGRNIRLRIRKTGLKRISHLVLQYRRTGRGTSRKYRTLRPRLSPKTRSVQFRKGRIGQTYLFRIRAVGKSGVQTNWRHSRTVYPYEDSGKGRIYSKGWKRVKNKLAWLGGYSQTSRRGATMRFTTRGGGRVYLVARTGPNGGKALVGRGTKKRVVSFRSKKRRNRSVVTVVNRTDKRAYRFTLRVLSGTVTVDGIGVRRR
jgi:hypothetical protein